MANFTVDSDPAPTPFNENNKMDKEMVAASDTILGMSMKTARMWQIIALVSLSSFILSLFICFYAVRLPKTIPVIVTVDNNGTATYVGKVDQKYWGRNSIPENHKTSQIKKFIFNLNTWVSDPYAQKNYQDVCFDICQGNAINQLDTFIRNDNPFDWIGVKSQRVEMDEPLKQTDKTYVIYYDIITSQNGYERERKRYSALVSLDYFEVTEETKDKNPLGVYITSFDIKEVKQNK